MDKKILKFLTIILGAVNMAVKIIGAPVVWLLCHGMSYFMVLFTWGLVSRERIFKQMWEEYWND